MTDTNVVPFGKYKGQTIGDIAQRDPAYLQWLTQQNWFIEKFQHLVVNVTNMVAAPEETPAHNEMQARFLDEGYRRAFALEAVDFDPLASFREVLVHRKWQAYRDLGHEKLNYGYRMFDRARWRKAERRRGDVTKVWQERRRLQAALRETDIGVECTPDKPQFETTTDIEFEVEFLLSEGTWTVTVPRCLMVEVKPSLGDDFPAVLRQMKAQRDRHAVLVQIGKLSGYPACRWVLAVGEYAGRGATFDQVTEMFEAADIMVINA
jgi:hypothetical protein